MGWRVAWCNGMAMSGPLFALIIKGKGMVWSSVCRSTVIITLDHWFRQLSNGLKHVCSNQFGACQVFDEMAAWDLNSNFAKLFLGCGLINVWHTVMVLVCKMDKVLKNPKWV